jgi:hypothetical protein
VLGNGLFNFNFYRNLYDYYDPTMDLNPFIYADNGEDVDFEDTIVWDDSENEGTKGHTHVYVSKQLE